MTSERLMKMISTETEPFIVTRDLKAFRTPKEKWLHTVGCEILTRAVND